MISLSVVKYWDKRKPEIEKYCAEHNLSVEKFRTARKSYGADVYFVVANTPENYDKDKPLPAALIVYVTESGLKFEQTEYTQKTLGYDNEQFQTDFSNLKI